MWIDERSLTYICHCGLRSCCSKRRCDFGFIMSSFLEAFVSWLRVGGMEQASGNVVIGIRAFSAHLLRILLLWSSTARLIVDFQVNAVVLAVLDEVEDICLVAPSDPAQTFNPNTLPLYCASLTLTSLLNFYTMTATCNYMYRSTPMIISRFPPSTPIRS